MLPQRFVLAAPRLNTLDRDPPRPVVESLHACSHAAKGSTPAMSASEAASARRVPPAPIGASVRTTRAGLPGISSSVLLCEKVLGLGLQRGEILGEVFFQAGVSATGDSGEFAADAQNLGVGFL